MKKLAILLTICTASMALAQMTVKASWSTLDMSRLWVNEQNPPTNLPIGLSVWVRLQDGEERIRIQPDTGPVAIVDVALMEDVGNDWRFYLFSNLSEFTDVPTSVTVSVMKWTAEPAVQVVIAQVGPLPADGRVNGDWMEYAGAEVHTAQPGQRVFMWHLTGETPRAMKVSVDDDAVEFIHGGTFAKLNEMKGGESVRLAEVR